MVGSARSVFIFKYTRRLDVVSALHCSLWPIQAWFTLLSTGIDGIYVDIPYWMTHFEGWENSWASFDDYNMNAVAPLAPRQSEEAGVRYVPSSIEK